MATTLYLRDYLWRKLQNATPGTTAATDYVGRAVQASNLDSTGRSLVGKKWATSQTWALGDYTVATTGQLLKCTTGGAGATTGGGPTAPGLGLTVTDGSAVWTQVDNVT